MVEWGMDMQKKERDLFIDNQKDILAKKHGYEVVRIDSLESTLEYIEYNIRNSKLPKYLNLNKIDFNLCGNFAMKNYYKNIVDEYREDNSIKAINLAKKYKISIGTVTRALRNAGFDYKMQPDKGHNLKNSKPVLIEKEIGTNEFLYFASALILEEESEVIFGEKISGESVKKAIRDGRTYKKRIVKYAA